MRLKKKKISKLFPCECGHSKRLHEVDSVFEEEWCNAKGKQGKYSSYLFCICDKYIPDNLKYLEKMARKKG